MGTVPVGDNQNSLLAAARRYLRRGWMPVYVPPGVKRPAHKGWQKQRLTEADLPTQFGRPGNIGIILGEPSGGLVDVDLDCPEAVELGDKHLPPTPAVTGRPSAQRSHRWYNSDVPATKQFRDPKTKAMIVELRSTGGQTLVGPSIHESGEPYDALDGEPARVPVAVLTACVQALYAEVVRRRYGEQQPDAPPPPAQPPAALPADVLERRAVAYLDAMPPAVSGFGGHSATYAAATALVHGFGLQPDRALRLLLEHYNPRCQPPWSEKELQHKVEDAASKPHDRPSGWLRDDVPDPESGVDISALLPKASGDKPPDVLDPGPVPDELLRIPGFVSEVMDHCLATAPYPNQVMAFCGALALQAFLAGRKVRDAAGNRTNIYLLGLAHSATGKDWPRRLNMRIAHRVGLSRAVAERFASGEGLQDALYTDPCMLFQTDEIDGMFRLVNGAQDARYENIITQLLMMYSSASTVFPMRKLAQQEHRVIDQPCLVLFGTAIPNHYYDALSARMLTNGLFARMLVLESGPRAKGKDAVEVDPPPRVLAVAKWWADFLPGEGNLRDWHPVPVVVEQTDEAKQFLSEAREHAEAEYAAAEKRNDALGTTVWGRVDEQTRKLALLYALSVDHEAPRIDALAVQWAHALVTHQTKRMLFMAANYVAENPFDKDCLKLIRKLREAGGTLAHSEALKNMHMQAKPFLELVQTLEQRGEVETVLEPAPKQGRPSRAYRLLGGCER